MIDRPSSITEEAAYRYLSFWDEKGQEEFLQTGILIEYLVDLLALSMLVPSTALH